MFRLVLYQAILLQFGIFCLLPIRRLFRSGFAKDYRISFFLGEIPFVGQSVKIADSMLEPVLVIWFFALTIKRLNGFGFLYIYDWVIYYEDRIVGLDINPRGALFSGCDWICLTQTFSV